MPVPLSPDQYLSDADKRLTKQDEAQQRSDLVAKNAQKWFDAYDELPKSEDDLNKQVVSLLNTTEARKAFHEKVREKFFALPDYKAYKAAVESGDETTKALLAPKYKEFYASQMPAHKQEELDKQRALVNEKRQALVDTIGTYIKNGGTQTAAEDIPTNLTPEQMKNVNAGLAYMPTFAQAKEETRKDNVFQGMSNETAVTKWGEEGPTFQQQSDLVKAIESETNPEFKAVLTKLQDNWQRERTGTPRYQNGLLDKLQKAANLATVSIAAPLKTLQQATTAQRTENEQSNSGNTVPTTVYGINPLLAGEQIAKHPVDTAKNLIANAYKGVTQSSFGGSTDSSANIGGVVAESNKQAPRNNEFVATGFGTNPGLMQDITQAVLPNPFAPEFKAAQVAGKVIGKGFGLAKDVVAGTEAGAQVLSKAEEAAQVVKTAFTRNAADKALGKAYGAVKGEAEGQKLSNTLEAAKEYGMGQREKFLAEKTGAPSYAAQIVKQESAGEHAFFTLNKAGLAKGTNSLTAAAKIAETMGEEDGIARSVVSHPDVVRAYSKMVGKEVSHVVMPTQYAAEMKTIVGAAEKDASLLNKKNDIVQGVVKAATTLNNEIYQPLNNTTRNFYLSLPRTSFRNLQANAELLGTMDPATYDPKILGQIAKHFGGAITDAAERAKPGIINAEGKTFTMGEVNDWMHNYGLAADIGRYGNRTSTASKYNPLRAVEKVSAIVSKPSYEASQAGDTAAKMALALSEMKRVKDLGPESSGQILKHVEEVMGLYSRMNSNADKIGKTATFAWSWNASVLPNLLKQGLKNNGKGLQDIYRLEELKQAYGQKNAKESDNPALLRTALNKFDIDKVYGNQSKLQTSKGSKENVLGQIETPLSTPSQFAEQGAEDSIKGLAPLGYRTIMALITGVDPETDKSIDKSVEVSYNKNGIVDAVKTIGDRAQLGAYTATGPAYKAYKDLYYLFKNRNEPSNMIDAAIKFRANNTSQPFTVFTGATPGIFESIGKPRYQENKNAVDTAKTQLDRYNFKQKAKVDQ